jgi:hypothetical protein
MVLLVGLSASACITHARDARSRPHVRRRGQNLALNWNVATAEHWHVAGNAHYDASASRTADGSGSFYYEDFRNAGRVASVLIPIEGGKKYTLGFFAKTANGPTLVSASVGIHDGNRKFIRNLPGVPEEAKFVQLKIHKMANTRPDGQVWVDEVYFSEGVGLEQPPSPKRAFDGAHVRVDELGNFEIRKDGTWEPFFPLCMYSDNDRDPSVYSEQGWNVIIWTSTASGVRRAKEAVSDFNPDGMLAGFQISQYTFPSGWAYHDLDDLREKLRAVFEAGLGESLLLYYWDNENNYGQWKVPVDVIRTIKSMDVDSSGRRLHPVYALQGNYGIARVHAARGLVDVSGVYVGGGVDAAGGAGSGDLDGLFVLDRLEGQISPAAFAQFNGVDGPGDMRLRLYNSIILGAKAMGYWRDCYKGCSGEFQKSVGPVDRKPWWPDFPNLRREVDKLLPLIRQPHWTSWSVRINPPDKVRAGTRDHNGEGCVILVNQTSSEQRVEVTLDGLPYTTQEVRDYFSDKRVASVRGTSFTAVLRKNDLASGTRVLRIVARAGER